jgi:hypothetical protein
VRGRKGRPKPLSIRAFVGFYTRVVEIGLTLLPEPKVAAELGIDLFVQILRLPFLCSLQPTLAVEVSQLIHLILAAARAGLAYRVADLLLRGGRLVGRRREDAVQPVSGCGHFREAIFSHELLHSVLRVARRFGNVALFLV